jgi:hypothetical protein
MAPLPTDISGPTSSLGAGTATGYDVLTACTADEQCATALYGEPNGYPTAGCYASPLVSCQPEANSSCVGDVLHSCFGVPYQQTIDCAASGQICVEDCVQGAYHPAECRAPLAPNQVACDLTSYVPSCDASGNLQKCDDSFQVGGQCTFFVKSHPCGSLGCVVNGQLSYDCVCADVVTATGTVGQCLSASTTLCDPATTPDTCAGTIAQTCIGYVSTRDCSTYGEVCQVAGGHAGCAAPSLSTCDPNAATTTCTGNTLSGCCPASGTFQTDAYAVPCAPGYEVSLSCPMLNPNLTCQTIGTAMCAQGP